MSILTRPRESSRRALCVCGGASDASVCGGASGASTTSFGMPPRASECPSLAGTFALHDAVTIALTLHDGRCSVSSVTFVVRDGHRVQGTSKSVFIQKRARLRSREHTDRGATGCMCIAPRSLLERTEQSSHHTRDTPRDIHARSTSRRGSTHRSLEVEHSHAVSHTKRECVGPLDRRIVSKSTWHDLKLIVGLRAT